jgi:hypothetical protein
MGRGIVALVADPAQNPLVDRIVQRQRGHELHRVLVLRHVEVLALTGTPPVLKGGQNGDDVESGRHKVGVGADVARLAVRPSRDVAEPGQ